MRAISEVRKLFSYHEMPNKPFWLNVYQGSVVEPRPLGAICTTRKVAEQVAGGAVLYRLHVTPKDRTIDLADVFGYGPSAPSWKEPT